jgi:hypothetical protein
VKLDSRDHGLNRFCCSYRDERHPFPCKLPPPTPGESPGPPVDDLQPFFPTIVKIGSLPYG